jgi:cobaltochelatase CobT
MGTGLQTPSGMTSEEEVKFKNPYKIFTSKFDEIIFPQKLIAKNELEILRDQLDLRLAKLSNISKKMSLKLKRKLLSKRNSFLEFDSSRGILDRKKLSRLVIDPMVEGIYVSNKNHDYQDTALTILLDNSGSMRGSPIVMSALACEIIAGILEKFSIKTEILGFTTADWKGGKARKLWESSGRPKNPGRLNELRHIIYKHFNQSFKKAKINLGLMLKEGVLKENIDGEALLFARSRLMQQSEKRKILLVISDGTPVDDSTTSANDSNILSDHLNHVINKIEKYSQKYSHGASKIEIVGIGIGHTTEEFYRNSITIKSLEELGDVMIEKISELL